MYSQPALKIYAAIKEGLIKSNAQFWNEFYGTEKFDELALPTEKYAEELNNISLICAYDDMFPPLPDNLTKSEKPYFFAYKGDISLLNNRKQNVAVVGTLDADDNIIKRENKIVERLVKRKFNIVSGLACGCDKAAHCECLAQNGKTIAFLPSAITHVYPERNAYIAELIAKNGGLIVSEYVTEPLNKNVRIARFIQRDRLQAMFAANIILIASGLPGQGDSGSRHAMAKALKYNTRRFVMYNGATDSANQLFGLNRQLLQEGAAILTRGILDEM